MVSLAFDIAEVIAGYAIGDGSVVADRVAQALSQIDDEELTLLVAAQDHTMFEAAFTARPDVNVVTDPTLSSGEARLRGRWSDTDLTRSGIRLALEEALDA